MTLEPSARSTAKAVRWPPADAAMCLTPVAPRTGAHLDTQVRVLRDEQTHEVGIELAQRLRTAVKNRAPGPSCCCDSRELERDEAAADERDAWRQRVELHELLAVDHQLLALDAERHRHRAGCEQERAGGVGLAADLESVRCHEAGDSVQLGDAQLGELGLEDVG